MKKGIISLLLCIVMLGGVSTAGCNSSSSKSAAGISEKAIAELKWFDENDDEETLTRLAKQGDTRAQFRLGFVNFNYPERINNPQDPLELYVKAAKQGYTPAELELAGYYIKKGENGEEALRLLKSAAGKDHVVACYILGTLYVHGVTLSEGVEAPKDIERGLKLVRSAAEKGYPQAQYALMKVYYGGYKEGGINKDYREALKWMRMAAEVGLWEIQPLIMKTYSELEMKGNDYEDAYFWLTVGSEYNLDVDADMKNELEGKLSAKKAEKIRDEAKTWLETYPRKEYFNDYEALITGEVIFGSALEM